MLRLANTTKIAALALAGVTLLTAVPASAGGGWGGYGGPGWGGPGPRGPGWGGPGWGPRRGWGPGPRYYYGGRNNTGAAVAAGVIGGLVVGGLAAAAANNYNQPRCWIETRSFYNSYGEPYYRDVEVCR